MPEKMLPVLNLLEHTDTDLNAGMSSSALERRVGEIKWVIESSTASLRSEEYGKPAITYMKWALEAYDHSLTSWKKLNKMKAKFRANIGREEEEACEAIMQSDWASATFFIACAKKGVAASDFAEEHQKNVDLWADRDRNQANYLTPSRQSPPEDIAARVPSPKSRAQRVDDDPILQGLINRYPEFDLPHEKRARPGPVSVLFCLERFGADIAE